MIDMATERIVSLTEATAILPRRRSGRKPNIATLYRWTTAGCRGIKLEYLQVGATRCTSHEALQRFFDALTAQAEPNTVCSTPSGIDRLPAGRRKQIEAAEARLAKAGI